MESMRITFAEKEKRLIREKEEENDFFQREIQKLKKKFGMKDDADIIDLDSSEDATLSGSEDISYANDEIEK